MKNNNEIKACILSEGCATLEIQNEYFPEWGFAKLRDWLEENIGDRHYPIELQSTEIALVTPFGVMMQIRPVDNDQLGLWGGILEAGETPKEGAVRELREETGVIIKEEDLEFIEIQEKLHIYGNGDKVNFKAYRYVVRLEEVPKITTNEESVGVMMVVHTIIEHQHDFVKRVLGEK